MPHSSHLALVQTAADAADANDSAGNEILILETEHAFGEYREFNYIVDGQLIARYQVRAPMVGREHLDRILTHGEYLRQLSATLLSASVLAVL